MNPRYTELAYELTVVEHLRQHLLDVYVERNGELICELLPGRLRRVPKTAFVEMLERLRLEKRDIETELKKYDFVRREPRLLAGKRESDDDEESGTEEERESAGTVEAAPGGRGAADADGEGPAESPDVHGKDPGH